MEYLQAFWGRRLPIEHTILPAQNSLLLISKPWCLSAPWWCSGMLKVHFSTSMEPGTPIPHFTSSDHFTPMNWVQVQSRLLSDVVYRLFLNGAPADLCPLFSLQPSPDHIIFPPRRKMFFLWYFVAATRMLSAVKANVAPGRGGNQRKMERITVWQPNNRDGQQPCQYIS